MTSTINFRKKRSENLADFLRERIRQKELVDPLPSTRLWCLQLGVGRPNLLRALKVLEHEGLLKVTGRGAVLKPSGERIKKVDTSSARILRILYYNRNAPNLRCDSEWISVLSERLSALNVHVSVESCSAGRLRALASQFVDNELCILMSVPPVYQKLFQDNRKPAFVIGYPGEDINLSFITADLDSAVRHATQSLLRRGFKRIVMVNSSHKAAGVDRSIEVFKSAIAGWPHQPVQHEVVLTWRDVTSMRMTLGKIAAKISEPCGFLIFSPVSVGVFITALLQAGVQMPKQAEIMAIEYLGEEVQFSIPVTRYGFPGEVCVKQLMEVSRHYFDTGMVPVMRKKLPLKVTVE